MTEVLALYSGLLFERIRLESSSVYEKDKRVCCFRTVMQEDQKT